MSSQTPHIVCTRCAAVNRTPVGRTLSAGKCGKCGTPLGSAKPIEVSPGAVDKLLTRDQGDFVIDAWAPWCGPCRAMAPAFEAVAQTYGGHLRFLKINVDRAPDVSRHLNVRGIPALFIFRNGRQAAFHAGMMSQHDLQDWVGATIGAPGAAA